MRVRSPAAGLSPNRSDRGGSPVSLVVLHYTGMESAAAAARRLCDPAAAVSAHYLLHPAGAIDRLVPEEECAWHAGRACWAGERRINARSLGIELVHPGHAGARPPYPDAQLAALEELLAGLLDRWRLPPAAVVGHSDVAPTRKRDPGEWFPWPRLAARGLAVWTPGPGAGAGACGPAEERRMWRALEEIGYDTGGHAAGAGLAATRACLRAFQRRFRPGELGRPLTRAALGQAEEIAARWPGRPAPGG